MESNGKRVRWDGSPVTTETGEVFWGEPGTNGQHAFYQLIHQGTRLIPADFIAVATPAHPLRTATPTCTSCSWPTSSPRPRRWRSARPPTRSAPRAPPEAIVPARVFPGNRPTTSIMAPALTPSVVGQLIALYEHITFTQGVVWGIDSFDQWGVELGKQLAHAGRPGGGRGRRRPGRPGPVDPGPDPLLPGAPRSADARVSRSTAGCRNSAAGYARLVTSTEELSIETWTDAARQVRGDAAAAVE